MEEAKMMTAVNGGGNVAGDQDEFDPSAAPPFKIADIRDAIPKHCWVKNPWTSLGYVLWDVLVIFALAAIAKSVSIGYVWPFYWVAQGTMFWAVFVLGHDCGHGSFSDSKMLNSFVGLILHSSILVPYHGWRISHRKHHNNHGHVENDESWVPMTESLYKRTASSTKTMRFSVPFPLFAYPMYLFYRAPGKEGSHFNPSTDLFSPNDRSDVIISALGCATMFALLCYLSIVMGPIQMFNLYFVPYWIFVIWLDAVTYLHHHGYEKKLPWYRGKEWSYLRGGLTTIDRDYGMFNKIHHDIGTHVVHHLFPQIPHYHLEEATKAAKPVLGKYYREPKKSGPIPFHLFKILTKSLGEDNYVSDTGDVVLYQTDPERLRFSKKAK